LSLQEEEERSSTGVDRNSGLMRAKVKWQPSCKKGCNKEAPPHPQSHGWDPPCMRRDGGDDSAWEGHGWNSGEPPNDLGNVSWTHTPNQRTHAG